jgi:hypothetical protein
VAHAQLFSIEMGSYKLLGRAGLQPRSFGSQPPTQLGMTGVCHQHTTVQCFLDDRVLSRIKHGDT